MHSLDKVFEFNGFRIVWIFGRLDAEMRARLVHFWSASGAIADPHEAWRRTFEVGCIALNADNDIIGVSSFYTDRLMADGRMYWFYRTFVRPDARVMGLALHIFRFTFDSLSSAYAGEPGAPAGVIVITENPKLQSRAGQRELKRCGLEPIGFDRQGRSVWRRCFTL